MMTLGIDIGSSSIKVALLEVESGKCNASVQLPQTEMEIQAIQSGWAEQYPLMWWNYFLQAIPQLLQQAHASKEDIRAIGISYQMHGLVCVDENMQAIRNSIIWCDSRAVPYGNKAFESIGSETCLSHLLNSPGNFTASKLAWVKENEPDNFKKIKHFMLPGDFIALMLTGEATTTLSGLSEGMLWDFKEQSPAWFLMEEFGFSRSLLANHAPTFGIQGKLTDKAAQETGLCAGTPVTYRAGDQPNNAFSLNVLNPGEIAATAGTSGVVYGVTDQVKFDPESRVNSFAHVTYTHENPKLGVLLCINGTGILNSWVRRQTAPDLSYDEMNRLAASVPAGSEGVTILPFGNGAERMLRNQEPGCIVSGLNFNIHSRNHLFRAAQEGIAFSFLYGMEIMKEVGINSSRIRAGKANMFLSPVFRQTLANLSGSIIQLYDTDGALGAARGAAYGAGLYTSFEETFRNLQALETIAPASASESLKDSYSLWRNNLEKSLKNQ